MWLRLCAAVGGAVFVFALASTAEGARNSSFQMYTLAGPGDAIAEAADGVELVAPRQTPSGLRADAVLTRAQRAELIDAGVKVRLLRNRKGKTVTQQARAQAANGFNVWRSWDEPGGIRGRAASPSLATTRRSSSSWSSGHTHQGRDIIALKLTQAAREVPDGSRPAVLYSSLQHAREWISVEVNRRLLHHFIDPVARERPRDQATC